VTGTRADLQAQLAPEFEILRPLGEGSTGSVHLARESALRRLVAIKIPRADVARDTVGRQRFEREARAAARLQHPSACAIHRIGHLPDGTPYLVMEYVKGRTLDDLLAAEGACSEATGTRIIAQVASALAAAHEQGVLHRDVRPNNVIWDAAAGRAVLTDFGLAVALLCPLTGRLRDRRCHARRRLLRTTARSQRRIRCRSLRSAVAGDGIGRLVRADAGPVLVVRSIAGGDGRRALDAGAGALLADDPAVLAYAAPCPRWRSRQRAGAAACFSPHVKSDRRQRRRRTHRGTGGPAEQAPARARARRGGRTRRSADLRWGDRSMAVGDGAFVLKKRLPRTEGCGAAVAAVPV
jgi:serine/threonine protein kinase